MVKEKVRFPFLNRVTKESLSITMTLGHRDEDIEEM